MEVRLYNQVHKSQREYAEDIAIAAEATHADRALQVAERFALVGREIGFRMCGAQHGFRDVRARPYSQRRAEVRHQFGFAVHADETLAENRLIDDAEHGAAIFFQRDKRTPFMSSCDEGPCAVHRIEDPGQAIRRYLLAKFFAENSVIRPLALDEGTDRFLGGFVGRGYRIKCAAFRKTFIHNVDRPPEIRTNHTPGGIGKAMGEVDDVGIDGHTTFKYACNPPNYNGNSINVPRINRAHLQQ